MLKFVVALAVVMIVSLLSLGWRVGVVVAAAVPLTLAIVLVVMLLTGRMLDRITLGALIISLGLLVDDAIIVIESMVVKMEEGFSRIDAASFSWTQTAAPRLAGSLATIIGFTPVGFALSTAGEYAGNIFWIVGFALITSWTVAAVFTPFLGVLMLPEIRKIEGDAYQHIYSTRNYNRLRRLVAWSVRRKFLVAAVTLGMFVGAIFGMGFVKQQFFPASDRTEVLVEVQIAGGHCHRGNQSGDGKARTLAAAAARGEDRDGLYRAAARRVSFLAYNPELPDPSFAKIIVQTSGDRDRNRLQEHLRQRVSDGLAPESRIRVTQLVFGPYTHFALMFRVMGPDADALRGIAGKVEAVMRANPHTRGVNTDWSERVPTMHFVLDQRRLQLIGPDARRRRPAASVPADRGRRSRRCARTSGRST